MLTRKLILSFHQLQSANSSESICGPVILVWITHEPSCEQVSHEKTKPELRDDANRMFVHWNILKTRLQKQCPPVFFLLPLGWIITKLQNISHFKISSRFKKLSSFEITANFYFVSNSAEAHFFKVGFPSSWDMEYIILCLIIWQMCMYEYTKRWKIWMA